MRSEGALSAARAATILSAVGCVLAVAACGSGSHAAGPKATSQQLLARCMRAHGVPNFPDPGAGGVGFAVSAIPGSPTLTVDGIAFSGPAFESAVKTCKLFGGGTAPPPISGAQQEQMIAKARCIRDHGVSNFPDPTFGPGGEGAGIKLGPGDNPQSPAVRHAAQACARVGAPIPGVGLDGPA